MTPLSQQVRHFPEAQDATHIPPAQWPGCSIGKAVLFTVFRAHFIVRVFIHSSRQPCISALNLKGMQPFIGFEFIFRGQDSTCSQQRVGRIHQWPVFHIVANGCPQPQGMGVAELRDKDKLHPVLRFVLQPHAKTILAGRPIGRDRLAVGHPGHHPLPGHDQHPMSRAVDITHFAPLTVETHGVGFGLFVDIGNHALDENPHHQQASRHAIICTGLKRKLHGRRNILVKVGVRE